MNDLRNKVILEADGKLMTGRDVAIAAMLGAEEFGFATAPLVTMGCVMMRVCNLDTCPVGIATQNPELRKRFRGKPEYVKNFMLFIAEELREYMSKLGVRTVDELVGRSDLLMSSDRADERNVILDKIINNPYIDMPQNKVKYHEKNVYDFQLEKTVDMRILMKKLGSALEKGQKKSVELDVVNTDRSVGTIFGSEITKKYGESLDEDTYIVKCNGAGGQSFGAFIPKGLTLELVGDSNDYFGKGLSGGKLIVYPPRSVKYKHEDNIIIGNVALYGATSGKAFINGVAGERFAVRNSGATAVVEGVGDHGCEYMTGGKVVVLGTTGKNFAAGMSGGIAYVLDMGNDLYKRLNKEMISIEAVTDKYEVSELKQLIMDHVNYTNSEIGKRILEDFEGYLPKFKKIIPKDYKKMMNMIVAFEEKGLSREKAAIEAFYKVKNGGEVGMGKPTGFLEYERKTSAELAPKDRIKNFNEFHTPLSRDEQRKQAARCMDCGVPFCQAGMNICGMTSGCPLNNLIPEWNDMLYNDNLEQAFARLSKTNCFPEFTSRVCPALCEKACTCNLNGDPVSVRENERAIIEYAFANDLVNDKQPKVHSGKKVAVIGSGAFGTGRGRPADRQRPRRDCV